jgi:hypothetical protein
MNFAVNYLAVIVAAVAGIAINALWYTTVAKKHVDALRASDATIAGRQPTPPMYAVAIVGQVLMALVLALILKMTGLFGLGGGMIVGFLCWLGFTITAMAQVQVYGYRRRGFLFIDGAVWLISALVMGAILGAWV